MIIPLRSCLVLGFSLVTTSVHADAPSLDVDAQYELGQNDYERNEYRKAQLQFTALYDQLTPTHDPRAAQVAYAAAQSSRYRGDFTLAFYYYDRALHEFALHELSDAQQIAWRDEARNQLQEARIHLTVVRLDLSEEPGAATLCGLRVNERGLVRIAPLVSPETPAANGGQGPWLPVIEGAATTDCVQTPEQLDLLVERGREHTLKVDRRVGNRKRPAQLVFHSDLDGAEVHTVRLQDEPASVVLSAAPRSRLPASPREVRGTLETADTKRADYPLIWGRPVEVAAGSYTPIVSSSEYTVAAVPSQVQLMAGERQDIAVRLEPHLPLYAKPAVWIVGGVLLAGAAALTAVLLSNGPAQRSVDSGTLGWTVPVSGARESR